MTENNIISKELKILVFRTDIYTLKSALSVRSELLLMNGIYRVNIDREDPEKVLRVECHPDSPSELIEELLAELGFNGVELSYEIFDSSDPSTIPNYDLKS